MTENEKLKCAIHCLKVNADMEVCEECEAYTSGDLACRDIAREAIKALEEVYEYRKLGTPQEIKDAMQETLSEIISIRKSLQNLTGRA